MNTPRVNLDVAILAQEAGFHLKSWSWLKQSLKDSTILENQKHFYLPAQGLLTKWFREKYNIHVLVLPNLEGYQGVVLNGKALTRIENGDDEITDYGGIDYVEHDDAMNQAFIQAFKQL